MTALDDIAVGLAAFDRAMMPGDLVEIRWTANHRYHAARALVMRKNEQSVACTLVEALDGYPKGKRITVPRVLTARWTADNGVFPLPPLQGILIDDKGARIARPRRRDVEIAELVGAEALEAEFFYVSHHRELHKAPLLVALRDSKWSQKLLPIACQSIPLRGPIFIVRKPFNAGGYWQSMTTRDVAEFTALFGVEVSWGDVQKGDVR